VSCAEGQVRLNCLLPLIAMDTVHVMLTACMCVCLDDDEDNDRVTVCSDEELLAMLSYVRFLPASCHLVSALPSGTGPDLK